MLRNKLIRFFILFSIIFSLLSVTAYADMGPKPSVNVSFKSANEDKFYVTLLSKEKGQGPWYIPEKDESIVDESYSNFDIEEYGIKKELWDIFSSFKDKDGYYLLPFIAECTDSFRWGYYPPESFKVLIYFPKSDLFAVSKIYERYAFDSYFEIDFKTMTKIDDNTSESSKDVYLIDCEPVSNYDYKTEAKAFISRILLTLLIEIGIAFIFGILNKRSFILLLSVNTVTQIFLNTALNIKSYYNGEGFTYYRYFVLLEGLILIFEAVCYVLALPKCTEKSTRKKAIAYAIIANSASLLSGLLFSKVLNSIL